MRLQVCSRNKGTCVGTGKPLFFADLKHATELEAAVWYVCASSLIQASACRRYLDPLISDSMVSCKEAASFNFCGQKRLNCVTGNCHLLAGKRDSLNDRYKTR